MRKTIIVLALAAGINAAGADNLLNPSPTYPVTDPVERLTSYPASIIAPKLQPPVDVDRLAKPAKHVIDGEPGGLLDKHKMRFVTWAQLGVGVEIRGMCQSACTLVMSYVPRERICFSGGGYLNFHKASNADGTASVESTWAMYASYPEDIQDWIIAQGGWLNMPHATMWTLRAPALWKMGYRRCD